MDLQLNGAMPNGPAPAADRRSEAVQCLAEAVRTRTGIKLLPQTESKLLRIFGNMAPDMLMAWVAQLEALPADHPEWMALIENLTVHETFFFRDRPQLDALRTEVLPRLLEAAARGDRRVRLWSAGCATGEEAYTLAILLLETMVDMDFAIGSPETGLRLEPGWQVSVLGTDISRPVLQLASQGIYHTGELSAFRSMPDIFLRWFEESRDGGQVLRRVRRVLREVTSFQPFNLLQARPPLPCCNLVVCRNVFIYLSQDAQLAALSMFAEALDEGGYLMLGPTDRMDLAHLYETEWKDANVLYRRKPGSGAISGASGGTR